MSVQLFELSDDLEVFGLDERLCEVHRLLTLDQTTEQGRNVLLDLLVFVASCCQFVTVECIVSSSEAEVILRTKVLVRPVDSNGYSSSVLGTDDAASITLQEVEYIDLAHTFSYRVDHCVSTNVDSGVRVLARDEVSVEVLDVTSGDDVSRLESVQYFPQLSTRDLILFRIVHDPEWILEYLDIPEYGQELALQEFD